MIANWLNYSEQPHVNDFKLIHVREKNTPSDDVIKYIQNKIVTSYRSVNLYKFTLEGATDAEIQSYVTDYVIPGAKNQIEKNVRQGDWGEILTCLIVQKFQGLNVPIDKLKWKFNKDRSVFSTDMLAHNQGENITDLYYYEIKTRLNPHKKESPAKGVSSEYITILAHNSLLKEQYAPTEAIADFLMRLYYEEKEYEKASKYRDIVRNPSNYNKNFELVFIIEKNKYIDDIINDLNNLPPQLTPLNVIIIFIENLNDLVEKSWKDIEKTVASIIK